MYESFYRIGLNQYAYPYEIEGYKCVLELKIPAEIRQFRGGEGILVQLEPKKGYEVRGVLEDFIKDADADLIGEIFSEIFFRSPGCVDEVSKLLLLNDEEFIEDVTNCASNREEAKRITKQVIIAHELGHIEDMCLIDRATMSYQFILLNLARLLRRDMENISICDLKPEAYFLDPVAMEAAALLREYDFWNEELDCVKSQINERRREWPHSAALEVCKVIERADKIDEAKKFVKDRFALCDKRGGYRTLRINKRIYYLILSSKAGKSVYDMLDDYEIIKIEDFCNVLEPLAFFTSYTVAEIENDEKVSLKFYVPGSLLEKREKIMEDLRNFWICSAAITRMKKDDENENNPFRPFISGGGSDFPWKGYITQGCEVSEFDLKQTLDVFYHKLLHDDNVRSISDSEKAFECSLKGVKEMENRNIADEFFKVIKGIEGYYYRESNNTSSDI